MNRRMRSGFASSRTRPRVGIMDSGIAADFATSVLAARDFTDASPGGQASSSWMADDTGHGTAVARLVLDGCEDADLILARIFGQGRVASVERVVAAMAWLVESRVQVINLSFGMAAQNPVLTCACHEAASMGVVLVASSPARGRATYPASEPVCLAVSGDARCGPHEISWLANAQAEFGAHPGLRHTQCAQAGGASFAAARVTGMVADLLAQGCPVAGIRPALRGRASYLGPERRNL